MKPTLLRQTRNLRIWLTIPEAYPSVRQFRQEAPGDWGPVIAEVETQLRLLAISRHPNAGRFPRIPLDTHRYYLAHSPLGMWAVLRLKDERGLDDWRARSWDHMLFPDPPPTITDVTAQVLTVLESALDLSDTDYKRAHAWVLVDEGCRFILTISETPPRTRPQPNARPLWMAFEGITLALCPVITGRAPGRRWSIVSGDYGYEAMCAWSEEMERARLNLEERCAH